MSLSQEDNAESMVAMAGSSTSVDDTLAAHVVPFRCPG